jgi:predicted RNA-binding Zn-ribbon protein involved in translation (DUF1610 family)
VEWYESVDETIGAVDRHSVQKMGRILGPLTYRRRFRCPFCGNENATETYLDIYTSARKTTREPTNEFDCQQCGWGIIRGRAELFPGLIIKELQLHKMEAPDINATKIEPLNVQGRKWRRTDPKGPKAEYKTMTQLIAATAKQHEELSMAQFAKKTRHKVKTLNPRSPSVTKRKVSGKTSPIVPNLYGFSGCSS